MAGLAATSSATPSIQRALIRGQLEAARREAEQAQANVQELRAQVNAAETESQKRHDKVRTLNGQAQQTDPTYNVTSVDSSTKSPVNTQEFIAGALGTTTVKPPVAGNGLKSNPEAGLVINSQGQSTGRIINFSA